MVKKVGELLFSIFSAAAQIAFSSGLAIYLNASREAELKAKLQDVSARSTDTGWDPWGPINDFERFQLYKESRAQCADFAQKNHDSFEKTLITLCGGAFGLSLTLVGQLKEVVVVWAVLLPVSWFCFAIGLCLMVQSFSLSHRAYERELDLTDERYFSFSQEVNQLRTQPFTFANLAMKIFYLGMMTLTVFAAANLENLMTQPKKQPGKIEERSNPPKVSPILTSPSRPASPSSTPATPAPQPASTPAVPKTPSQSSANDGK